MKHPLKIVCLFFVLFFVAQINAQEFNCKVQVATPKIQRSDKRIFTTLQSAIFEFMNERKWSNYSYKVEERIECSIMITINEEVSADKFKGTIQVQARRPIYKSSYNSVLLNTIDKDFSFNYEEYQSLEFDDNAFILNITSVLAYYSYLILGLDFDSYTPNGGTAFFEKAQNVVNMSQSTSHTGWKSTDRHKRNRYWIVENILNQSYASYRTASYEYHRKGMDLMHDNVQSSRKIITLSIEKIHKLNREKSGIAILNLFMLAKADELVNVFSEATVVDKEKMKKMLLELDPANASKYRKLTGG